MKIAGIDVTIKGNEGAAKAVWTKDGLTYSIYADKEISEQDITNIIASIR